MLLYILITVAVLIVGLVGYAATKPSSVRYERSISINAAADRILPHVADFHNWTAWSPYEKIDPTMKRAYGGADAGQGAAYSWEGNSKAGAGSMVITSASANELKIDLNFLKPFKNECKVVFSFIPEGSATKVTWRMDGPQPLMARVAGIFMDFDKLVGGQFAEGLANLKQVMEK